MGRHRQYRKIARRNKTLDRASNTQRAEEQRWAELAGPVEVTVVGPAGGVRPRETKSAPETRRGAGAREKYGENLTG